MKAQAPLGLWKRTKPTQVPVLEVLSHQLHLLLCCFQSEGGEIIWKDRVLEAANKVLLCQLSPCICLEAETAS